MKSKQVQEFEDYVVEKCKLFSRGRMRRPRQLIIGRNQIDLVEADFEKMLWRSGINLIRDKNAQSKLVIK